VGPTPTGWWGLPPQDGGASPHRMVRLTPTGWWGLPHTIVGPTPTQASALQKNCLCLNLFYFFSL